MRVATICLHQGLKFIAISLFFLKQEHFQSKNCVFAFGDKNTIVVCFSILEKSKKKLGKFSKN